LTFATTLLSTNSERPDRIASAPGPAWNETAGGVAFTF
jgi:hypothetical protein